MNKVRYMDEEILKMQIPVNSEIIDNILKKLSVNAIKLASREKASA